MFRSPYRKLGLRGRLAAALLCFDGLCQTRSIDSRLVDEFVEHLWRFLSLNFETDLRVWEDERPDLVLLPFEDEEPRGIPDLAKKLGLSDSVFRRLIERIVEIVYGSLYGAVNNGESLRDLKWVFRICEEAGITPPPAKLFFSCRFSDDDGWGFPLSEEELLEWRKFKCTPQGGTANR